MLRLFYRNLTPACHTGAVIPVVLTDVETGEKWFARMPAAPPVGSVISVWVPDVPVHKVVESVVYECMAAEIGKSDVKFNPNDYPAPYNPNGYPECSLTVYVSNAVWSQKLMRWVPPPVA